MEFKKMRDLSYYIISEYYKNNLDPFFEYLDEKVVWYGPAEGQKIFSKKSMLGAWGKEKHNLKFTMSDVKDYVVPINKNALSVILSYHVYTHYPNGVTHIHNQNLDMTWISRKIKTPNGKMMEKSSIIKIFISNLHQKNEYDNIYAINGENEKYAYFDTSVDQNIIVKDKIGTIYRIICSNIIYIEKKDEGRHSVIYTTTETIECMEKTNDIVKQNDNFFISPHISYLVNPLHIKKIERFKLTLDNNKILPIAEKKYTKFKNDFTSYESNNNL